MFRPTIRPGGAVSVTQRAFSVPSLVSLALAAAFLIFLMVRFDVDLGFAWRQIKSANPWILALALLVHYTTFVFRGVRWRLLLQNAQPNDKSPPGVLYCSELTLLGWFANSVAWFRLGDAYRAYLYHHEQEESFSRTIGTILSERMLDTLLVVALLLLSAIFMLGSGPGTSWVVLGTALGLLTAIGLTLTVLARARTWMLRWLPSWLAQRYQLFYEGALGSLQQLPWVTFWGLLGWLAEVARLYLVTQALEIDLSFALIVFITLANSLLTLVPTPGGIGAVESGVAGLLVRLSSLTASGAAALVLVDRSISYVSIILSGAAVFVARNALHRRTLRMKALTAVEPQ